MFGVMLILSIPCLLVLLQLARGHVSSEKQVGTWNLKCQASCALDHFFLPTHVLINHNDLLSHPVLEGKPNANHVRARISYSRTQQLHNMDIITQCSK
jgi:hypothetical protein